MNSKNLIPITELCLALPTDDLLDAFAQFLHLDVANGDASLDTIAGYRSQVQQWVDWCAANSIDPAIATEHQVKLYRQHLVEGGYKASSIGHKLVVLRRLYAAAQQRGWRTDNPVDGVRPPRDKRPVDDVPVLAEVDVALLLRAVPRDGTEANLRDRAMLGLLALQGLRTVEIHRANFDDLQTRGESTVLHVHGKGRDRLAYLRPDVADALREYLAAKREAIPDEQGTPLFTAVGNRSGGRRLSRRGIRKIVDGYLRQIEAKRPGLSNHALRHSAGTLAYRYSKDIRAVQDMLGHADPKTTARYAHIVDREQDNVAAKVPLKL